jgi:hypothetical protein
VGHLRAQAGPIGAGAGVLGALSALVLLAWPPQVPRNLVSYPLTTDGFVVAQTWFFVQHLGLLTLLVALARSPAIGRGLIARGGAWLAVAGMTLLAVTELVAMRYATWDDDAAYAGLMGTAYGLSSTVTGAGLCIAGVGVLRAGAWGSWRRWTPLAVGVAVFAIVTPGMFGGFILGRLAIGTWMALFAALGWSMHVESRRSSAPAPAAMAAG